MKLYKIVAANGSACHGGKGKWRLPAGEKPGAWMPKVAGEIKCCRNGYHLATATQLLDWLKTDCAVYEAEGRGTCDKARDKTAYRQARLVRKVGVLTPRLLATWALDCAERALPIFEKNTPAISARARQSRRPARRCDTRGYRLGRRPRRRGRREKEPGRAAARAAETRSRLRPVIGGPGPRLHEGALPSGLQRRGTTI